MEQLMDLLRQGVTPSHVMAWVKRELVAKHKFTELDFDNEFVLKEQGLYYVNLYGTNGMAFRVGGNMTEQPVFRVGMAHSDAPCFQIKPNGVQKGSHISKFNVEMYGGMNQKSWFDRPLGVAGKMIVKGEDTFMPNTILYKSESPLAIIPSLAIHMDREVNKKGELDVAKELVPLISLQEDVDFLQRIAEELQIAREDILDYDLFLYNMEQPVLCGLDRSLLVSPKLDNLTSVAALVSGLLQCEKVPDNTVDMMVVFDHEEVGSRTEQGADSELLSMLLEKIGRTFGGTKDGMLAAARQSFLLSMDVAHAHHPNYEEKSDAVNKAYLGCGFSLKRSIGRKYGTTAESGAVVKAICEKEQIPYTIAINKTGIPGGSTLGPIVTSHIPFPCADVGMPILAMHSATEVGAVKDYEALRTFAKAFFES